MLISDAFCYALLAITITATCAAGQPTKQEEAERRVEKRNKREAALLIDSYPTSTYKAKPDIIYQRVSKTKYRKPKQKYGPVVPRYRPPKPMYGPPKPKPKYGPPKPKYGPPKPPPYKNRKPVKKHRRKPIRASKFNNKRIPMSKYGPVKKPHGPPKHKRPQNQPQYPPEPFGEPAGFGEPPKDHVKEYVQPPQQNYAEPPVDSYGVPLKAANFPTTDHFNNAPNYDDFGQQFQSYQSYQQDLNVDNLNAHTKNRPIYAEPEDVTDEEPQSKYENFNLDSYSDVYKNSLFYTDISNTKSRYHFPPSIQKNRPWKSHLKPEAESGERIVVGGQYAEPPGRLVRQSQPNAPIHGEDEFPPSSYADSEVAASATISPYVNYKHSNMAFSPQNLNDAFSITK